MCSRFLLTFRNMGYLGTLIMVIFLSVYLKGIWDTCLFALRDMEY